MEAIEFAAKCKKDKVEELDSSYLKEDTFKYYEVDERNSIIIDKKEKTIYAVYYSKDNTVLNMYPIKKFN